MIYTTQIRKGAATHFWAMLTIASLVLSAFPAAFFVAEAQAPEKVDICHATNSHSNPYGPQHQSPNENADVSGHDGHTGPVWFPGITEDWGDIIPPFDYDGGSYPGKNWNTEGQTIYNNNCQVPQPITGSISGTKYDDVGNDGSIGGDSPIPGWTIRLYKVDGAWTLEDTEVTNGSGEYEFTGLTEGEYKVCEVMQDDWTQTFASSPAANGSPNSSEEGPSCQTVNIDTQDETNTKNFGNYYEEPQVDFCDPSQKPGGVSIAGWHEANGFDGTDCFEYEVVQQCGSLDVQFTTNETPYGYAFNYVIGTETPELADFGGDGTLPVNFSEDENGGSVDVTYYVVGAESDFFTGSDVPNIWDGNGVTVTIDTDCSDEPEQCVNLLENGSFEEPIVTHVNLWDKFGVVAGWTIERILDDSPTTLELHRDWSSNEAAHGEQYAELDGDWSTKISQTIATLDGGEYELSWAFAPRHDITAAQNQLSVLVDGSEVATEGPDTGSANLTPGDWTRNSYTFTADASTDITFADAGPSDSYGTFLDDAQLCLVREPQQCEPEEHVFADNAEDDGQGLTKGGAAVAAGRSNPDDATGDPDWNPGDSDGFYSLGFGGWIIVSFDKFVVNVEGDDLSIHEATNGTYPLETAKVEVSQNGTDWEELSEEARNDNDDGDDGVTLLDFDETGLDWIKYVRITDTSDPNLHSNDADGFDLDTVDATYVVCDEPEPEPENECLIEGYKYDSETGEPLSHWFIGLVKTLSFGQHESQPWLIGFDKTDENGYYCIEEKKFHHEKDWDYGHFDKKEDKNFLNQFPAFNFGFNKNYYVFEWLKNDDWSPVEATVDGATTTLESWHEEEVHVPVDLEDDHWVNFYNTDDGSGPDQCTLEIVSDTGTLVVNDNDFAVATYDDHVAWTASIPGATWVWDTFNVVDPEVDTTRTFRETFTVDNPSSALLDVAADNSYVVKVNGVTVIDRSTDETNFSAATQMDDVDILAELVSGENTIEIEVRNWGLADSTAESNPAGVLYKLNIEGESDCDRTTEPEDGGGGGPDPDTQRIDGYKYDVTSGTTTLAGWTIFAENTSEAITLSTTTDSNGYYYFDVEDDGTWEITEEVQTDWVQVQVEQDGVIVPKIGENVAYCTFEVPDESDYECDFYNEFTPDDNGPGEPQEPEPVVERSSRNSSSGGRPRLREPAPTPIVLGESVSVCPFLKDYMQIGIQNDSFEVTKLQLFLNIFRSMFGGANNPITGVFDATTDANVKVLQEHYRSEVLDPWFIRGIVPHNEPTGFVYKTTLWKINSIICPEEAVEPDFTGEDLTQNVDID